MKFPLVLALVATFPLAALANAVVGQPAPAFAVTDLAGKPVKLEDFKGKTVVLEWHNFGCPFVQKHYGTGNMQATQKWAKDHGAIWLTMDSAAPGRQGDVASSLRMAITNGGIRADASARSSSIAATVSRSVLRR